MQITWSINRRYTKPGVTEFGLNHSPSCRSLLLALISHQSVDTLPSLKCMPFLLTNSNRWKHPNLSRNSWYIYPVMRKKHDEKGKHSKMQSAHIFHPFACCSSTDKPDAATSVPPLSATTIGRRDERQHLRP